MKKFMLFACLLMAQLSFGAESPNPELRSEITQKLNLDLSEIQLNRKREDFVMVKFTVCDGKVCVSGITGTQKVLIEQVQLKLSEMVIEGGYTEDTSYLFKFTFRKL